MPTAEQPYPNSPMVKWQQNHFSSFTDALGNECISCEIITMTGPDGSECSHASCQLVLGKTELAFISKQHADDIDEWSDALFDAGLTVAERLASGIAHAVAVSDATVLLSMTVWHHSSTGLVADALHAIEQLLTRLPLTVFHKLQPHDMVSEPCAWLKQPPGYDVALRWTLWDGHGTSVDVRSRAQLTPREPG